MQSCTWQVHVACQACLLFCVVVSASVRYVTRCCEHLLIHPCCSMMNKLQQRLMWQSSCVCVTDAAPNSYGAPVATAVHMLRCALSGRLWGLGGGWVAAGMSLVWVPHALGGFLVG
jgi:uncharacterized membrane protein